MMLFLTKFSVVRPVSPHRSISGDLMHKKEKCALDLLR
jgi:hypothetical protein